jgi:hypothetical protein
MNPENAGESPVISKRKYEKPAVKSSTIKETFLACGKCTDGPVEQFLCVIFPELS